MRNHRKDKTVKVITYPDGDQDWAEEYDSIEDVEKELKLSADDDYRGTVLAKLRAGETSFTIANGPDTDVWEVVPG
jgi:hypothetical protein